MLFEAFLGSTPIVALLPFAIIFMALINMMAEWMKGEKMNTKTTTTTKFYMFLRKLAGNILLMTAAWGISATAGFAGLQL